MVYSCVAVGCTNRKKPGCTLSFYRFPSNKHKKHMWIAAVKRENWQPTANTRLCSQHFISGQRSTDPLSPDYVPSVFQYTTSRERYRQNAALEKYAIRQALNNNREERVQHLSEPGSVHIIQASHSVEVEEVHTDPSTTEDHFEADQFEANRKDGWRKLKQNAVPTIFNGQQLEVAKEHSYAKYRCVRVETSDVGATEDKEDIPDTRNSTMNNTEQYHTKNFSGESKIGIWDNSEAEQHHNNFTNDSKINVWNSSDDRHINSPQPTDSYTGCMIKEEPPDSLPQNSPKHPPPTAEEDIVVVKEEVPDPSWSSLSKIGDGEETRGNIIANNTPSDIEFDLPLTVEPANPLVDIQKEQMAFLKTKIKALKNQLRRKNSKHRAFYQNIRRLFNPDQIAALTHSTKWDQNNWSSNTMRKAAEMRRICGALGYQLLLDRGYPLPCLMTLQTAKGKTT